MFCFYLVIVLFTSFHTGCGLQIVTSFVFKANRVTIWVPHPVLYLLLSVFM